MRGTCFLTLRSNLVWIAVGLTSCQTHRTQPPNSPVDGYSVASRVDKHGQLIADWNRFGENIISVSGARARLIKRFVISAYGNSFSKQDAVSFYRSLAAEDRESAQQLKVLTFAAGEKRVNELRDGYIASLEREAKCSDRVMSALVTEIPVWEQLLNVTASLRSPNPEKPLEQFERIVHQYILAANSDDTAFADFASAGTRLADLSSSTDKIRKSLEQDYAVHLNKIKPM